MTKRTAPSKLTRTFEGGHAGKEAGQNLGGEKKEKKMKLIEALKQIKDLSRKADDLKEKMAQNSAYLDFETPKYTDQKKQVSEWIQAHSDILKEILRLRIAIQKTNLAVDVVIELGGKQITKTIAEWIHRRRDLAKAEATIWHKLTDKGLKEGKFKESTGEERIIKIVRCYDQSVKDERIELFTSEPSVIDGRLEITNAVTDLME